MEKATAQKYFPGSNSPFGFYSYYDHIAGNRALRLFIFKGGPGVGKSSFMRYIGENFRNEGWEVEYHYCSSDHNSLDALVIPSARITFMDGTPPHNRDPVYPGALEEIINLGEYWDEHELIKYRDNIINLSRDIKNCFDLGYRLLFEAYGSYMQIKELLETKKPPRDCFYLTKLVEGYFNKKSFVIPYKYEPRSLFASAITPQGISHVIDSIVHPSLNVYVIKGRECGIFVKSGLNKIAQMAWERGYFVEKYHCPFDPEHLDGLIVPDLQIALFNGTSPYHDERFDLPGYNLFEVEINNNSCTPREKNYINDAYRRMDLLINQAVEHFKMAKNNHDTLEEYYVNAMDYRRLEFKREEIYQKVKNMVNAGVGL